MSRYEELKDIQGERVDAFLIKYAFFAFTREQFREGLRKLGIPEEEAGARLVKLGNTGGYILKDRANEYVELSKTIAEELQAAIHDPETGPEFAFQMFHYELLNHEYGYTGSVRDTLDGLGFTPEEVRADPVLDKALKEAKETILKNGEE